MTVQAGKAAAEPALYADRVPAERQAVQSQSAAGCCLATENGHIFACLSGGKRERGPFRSTVTDRGRKGRAIAHGKRGRRGILRSALPCKKVRLRTGCLKFPVGHEIPLRLCPRAPEILRFSRIPRYPSICQNGIDPFRKFSGLFLLEAGSEYSEVHSIERRLFQNRSTLPAPIGLTALSPKALLKYRSVFSPVQ